MLPSGEKKLTELQASEHHTLKVPYELLNKKFRWGQKAIDKEAFHVNATVSELERVLNNNEASSSHLSVMLGGVMEKLSSFKRKAEAVSQEELESSRAVRRRVDVVKDCASSDPCVVEQWRKMRTDRLVIEYLFRCGYYKTAIEIVKSRGLEHVSNIEIFQTASEVESGLKAKDPSKCLAWCHDNKSKLKKINSTLEFNIRVQEFVELIKQDRKMEAVRHARGSFNNPESSQIATIQKVMVLLAFNTPFDLTTYKELLDDNRWIQLRKQFREENLRLFQMSPQSVFCAALQCGLSALKTPNCYRGPISNNNDCPVCEKGLNTLAAPLPYAHCSQSRLVCHISGDQMNEHNQPLMLPNGYIYGQKALEKMANENNGFVVCPRTNSTFNFVNVEKVYVM